MDRKSALSSNKDAGGYVYGFLWIYFYGAEARQRRNIVLDR